MTAGLFAAAWLFGLLCAAWAPGWAVIAAAPACALTGWLGGSRTVRALPLAFACAGLVLLGAWRWQSAVVPAGRPSGIERFVDAGPVRAAGIVTGSPEERERYQRLTVRLRSVELGGERALEPGQVLVRTTLGRRFRAGDVLDLHGNLELPAAFPGFDYRAYLAQRGIAAELGYPRIAVIGYQRPPLARRLIDNARGAVAAALARALPHPESDLATGMLTGMRGGIPRELTEDFNTSGTSHLIAISGFNISILAGAVLTALAGLLHRRWAALIAAATISAYAAFAGLTASVTRALLMGLLLIWTEQLGRPGSPLLALAVAAALMTGQDPRIVNDLGFQLSFTATAGIMLGQPVLQGLCHRLIGAGDDRIRAALRWWAELATVTLAATLATLPVMLHAFGRAPLAGIPANLLAGPLFPLVLLTSTLAAGWSLLLPDLAAVAGAVAWPPLALTIAIARTAAAAPWASLSLPPVSGATALGLAALLLAGTLWLRRRLRMGGVEEGEAPAMRLHPYAAAAAAVALIAAFNLWAALRPDPASGRLEVVFAEAGGAPVALVSGPGGERILIDTGPSAAAHARSLDPLLPATGRRVALIVLTRDSPAAAGGLSGAVERYTPAAVLAEESAAGDLEGTALVPLTAGLSITLASGAHLTFAPPLDDGGRWRVTAAWRGVRIALTPGAEGDAVLTRAAQEPPGALAVTFADAALPAYSVRRQGPVRVSTDGRSLRATVTSGPLLSVAADGLAERGERR